MDCKQRKRTFVWEKSSFKMADVPDWMRESNDGPPKTEQKIEKKKKAGKSGGFFGKKKEKDTRTVESAEKESFNLDLGLDDMDDLEAAIAAAKSQSRQLEEAVESEVTATSSHGNESAHKTAQVKETPSWMDEAANDDTPSWAKESNDSNASKISDKNSKAVEFSAEQDAPSWMTGEDTSHKDVEDDGNSITASAVDKDAPGWMGGNADSSVTENETSAASDNGNYGSNKPDWLSSPKSTDQNTALGQHPKDGQNDGEKTLVRSGSQGFNASFEQSLSNCTVCCNGLQSSVIMVMLLVAVVAPVGIFAGSFYYTCLSVDQTLYKQIGLAIQVVLAGLTFWDFWGSRAHIDRWTYLKATKRQQHDYDDRYKLAKRYKYLVDR
jgi:hypothetical protein